MGKGYKKFNLICLILSGVFLLGIGWVWQGIRNTNSYEIIPPQRDPVFNSGTNYENNIEIKKLGNLSRSERDPAVAGETDDSTIKPLNLPTGQAGNSTIAQVAEERDSSSRLEAGTRNLNVPFTSQAPEKNWEEPWQDACEEAALLMLDAYYKNYNLSPLFAKDELLKMIKWEEEQGWGMSIPMEKVASIAREYLKLNIISVKEKEIKKFRNLEIKVVENPTVEQIKKSIASGNPVLATADGKVLPNPHYRNGGPVYHALIIKGYTETEFITNDPGTQFGKDFKYKYNDLMNAIHDWNGGDVKNGPRVVLIFY